MDIRFEQSLHSHSRLIAVSWSGCNGDIITISVIIQYPLASIRVPAFLADQTAAPPAVDKLASTVEVPTMPIKFGQDASELFFLVADAVGIALVPPLDIATGRVRYEIGSLDAEALLAVHESWLLDHVFDLPEFVPRPAVLGV